MGITLILTLLGGLALFLYGMQMMSSGLEAAAGNRMKRILGRLTSNRLLGVATGAGITAVIQSSSATTVMVVGFVNSGILTLGQAVGVIMGANIGTTVTGQLIALDAAVIAPVLAFIGVVLVVFMKKPSFHHYGMIIAGLGVLFLGMDMMSSAMSPLRESQAFIDLMTNFGNPLIGILVGMVFTAVIQSSSASVGILQALAISGLIGLPNAVYVLFGQNIGTCITAVLASIGAERNAKRAALIHVMFNVIGTVLFTAVCMSTQLTDWVASWTPGNPAAQIANMHTLFNIVTTVLLLPFGGKLAQLSMRILPEKPTERKSGPALVYIKPIPEGQEHRIGNSAIAVTGIRKELARMAAMAAENVENGFLAAEEGRADRLPQVERSEEYIDYLNKEISKYISRIIYGSNEKDALLLSALFKVSGDLERIGDHAVNLCQYSRYFEEKNIAFSEQAKKEIEQMRRASLDSLRLVADLENISAEKLKNVEGAEQRIDDMTEKFRENQLVRLHKGQCSDETCVLYSEMLTDFERIGDHVLNIAQALAPLGAA